MKGNLCISKYREAKVDKKPSAEKILYVVDTVAGWLALLIYLSMHTMLGFIGHATFSALPYILGALIIASAVTATVITLAKNNKILLIVTLTVNGMALIGSLAYFFAMLTHFRSFLLSGLSILAFYVFVAIVVYLIFYFPKQNFKGKNLVAAVLCAVLVGGALLNFTDFRTLRINFVSDGAAVYAVGDEYQIVWTTAAEGMGWVEIGGESYYDEYAGSKRTNEKVHKVSVPMEVLDEHKSYTVCSRAMLSEQGFSGLNGYKVSKIYSFRPVDDSDGIQAYAVSDSHDYNNIVKKTADYYGDKTDFIVIAGDAVSFVDTETDLARILNLAHSLTGGNIPVVFARGNHEVKCPDAENLHKYVGAEGEKFYYTFRLGSVWGVVLDMGEDHADDWYEFYDTAVYDGYRAAQVEFLDEVIAKADSEYLADGVEYRIAVCHMPTAMVGYTSDYMYDVAVKINERLNQMDLDVMLSGHLHQIFKIEAGYEAGRPLFYRTEYSGKEVSETPDFLAAGANFPTVLVSRRSDVQSVTESESKFGYKFIGTALELTSEEKTARYTDADGQVLFSINPFENIDYGKIIVL